MKHILTALLLSITILSFGQTTMNIYQNNGTTVNLPVSTIDSLNFTTTPPPSRMNIYQMGGGIISIVIANIDSITYTVQGTSGLAVLSTDSVTNIDSTSAVSGGDIVNNGGSPVTQRGVVWSTTPNPTTANNNTIDGSGTGSFSSTLTGLISNTTYYVRAYATNANGTAYGNEVSFTTLNSNSIPTITTDSITTIDNVSAVSGGNIVSNGGSPVTQRGVVWSTSQNPSLANNSTNNGTNTGSFSSSLTGLTANTTYYVRAYATNTNGTAYGNELSFTTLNYTSIPTITTDSITNIDSTSAVSGGDIINNGGSPVTQRGVVWSTSQNPSIANNSTNDGTGIGSFSSTLTGLTANTTYYVRAYATNTNGTAYGNELSFTNSIPTITTNSITNIGGISAASGGNILSDSGSPVTQRGVVWGTTPNPTTANNILNNGTGMGSFSSILTGLTANTLYWLRAYATNSVGTAYGNELDFTTTAQISSPGAGVIFDGYNYASLVLGNQEWMAENLRTTVYANGDPIPNVTAATQWRNLSTGAWAHQLNDSQNEDPYGKLYNWYTVADSRNLCPIGWHVPTSAEWLILTSYLGGAGGDGSKVKSIGNQYWRPGTNQDATNESGFSAVGGGIRTDFGNFEDQTDASVWWTPTATNITSAEKISLYGNATALYYYGGANKISGLSVRCLKD